jgi:hypothetical protein
MTNGLVPSDEAWYLFQTRGSLAGFVLIDEELAQLNDYCLALLEAASAKHNEHTKFYDWLAARQKPSIPLGKDKAVEFSPEDVELGRAFTQEVWADTARFLVPATCLSLLSCFTERSLRYLCDWLEAGAKRKRSKGTSDIESYLALLRAECGLVIDEPKDTFKVREVCRRVRNDFAHGEWDKCRRAMSRLDLALAFNSVAALFFAIEQAAEANSLGRRL